MLLRVDVLARAVLRAVQAGGFALRDLAVGLVLGFDRVDPGLLFLEAVGFLRRELARGCAFGDTALLARFALVDALDDACRGKAS